MRYGPISFAASGADSRSGRWGLEGCEPLLQSHSAAARAAPLSANALVRPREVNRESLLLKAPTISIRVFFFLRSFFRSMLETIRETPPSFRRTAASPGH